MLAKVIIPYFGQLPWWMNFFLLSCSRNPRIIWTIFTDASTDNLLSTPNVIFKKIEFEEYKKIVAARLDLDFDPLQPVKFCDIKPFLGFIHPEEVVGFKYWGFGDIDVIYGNLSDFLSKMKFWSVISFHDERLSGHLAFFKNNANTTRLAIQHPNWREILAETEYMGFDEYYLSGFLSRRFFTPKRGARFTNAIQPPWLVRFLRGVRFKEEYTTPLTGRVWRDGTLFEKQPSDWHWEKGSIYACRERISTPYLHLMNFKSSEWNKMAEASWGDESKLLRFKPSNKTEEFFISKLGITPKAV